MNDKVRERNTREGGCYLILFFLKIKELESRPVSIFPVFLKPLDQVRPQTACASASHS